MALEATLNQHEYDELFSLYGDTTKFSKRTKVLLNNTANEILLNEILKADKYGANHGIEFFIKCNKHNGFFKICVENGYWLIAYKSPQE